MNTPSIPYEMKEIAINDILMPEIEMRSQVEFEALDELARSIAKCGLMNPPSIRPKGDKYELIAGFRRIKAHEILGRQTILCRIFYSDDELADLQKAHENLFREDVNPLDEGKYFKILLQKNNWQLTDLAVMLHRSPAFVSRRISLCDGDKTIAEAVRDGKINLTVAEELNKVENKRSMLYLLSHCINSGATSETVRSWRIQSNMENNQPAQQETVVIDPQTGKPLTEEEKMQKLTEDTGPKFELKESLFEYRVCIGCQGKTDVKDVFTAHFCPTCADVLMKSLKGEK